LDAARLAAQQFFAAVLPAPAPPGRMREQPKLGGPPLIKIRGGWWRRRKLRRRLRQLWQLTQNQAPGRMTSHDFARLLGELRRLRAMVAAGDLHFERPHRPGKVARSV